MDSVSSVEHGELSSVDHELTCAQETSNTKMADHQLLQAPVSDVPLSKENGQVDIENDALKNAQEKIQILEKEIIDAKDEVIRCKKASEEEISRLCNELQAKHESAVSEVAHLSEELDILKNEASNSKIDLQKTREECEILKEKLNDVEKELSTAHERIKESEDRFLAQKKSHHEELLTRDENEVSINKAHEGTRVQLQTVQNRVVEMDDTIAALHKDMDSLKSEFEEQSKQQESKFKVELRMAEEKHANTVKSMAELEEKVIELEKTLATTTSDHETAIKKIVELEHALETASEEKAKLEEQLKQQQSQFQVELKMAEEKYADNVKSMSELEGKVTELEKSLATTTSDHGTTLKKFAELEHALKTAKEEKAKLEEGASELQVKLRGKDELSEKLAENLKEIEAKLGKANNDVLQLESTLRVSEEKLKANKGVEEGLQSQLTELKKLNETQTKCLEEAKENLQLELRVKLTLEGKIKELQESLDGMQREAGNLTNKVEHLDDYVKSLETEKCQLEKQLRDSEEKCSQHVNSVQTSTARSVELEDIVVQHRTIADDAVNKLAALEATLVDAKNRNSELEAALADYQKSNEALQMKFDHAQEIVLRLQNETNDSSSQITKLESLEKASAAKVTELENVYADSKKREELLSQKLASTETLLAERQAEIDDLNKRISQLEQFTAKLESELTTSTGRERNLIKEKELLEAGVAEIQIQVESATAKIVELESSMAAVAKDLHDALENKNYLSNQNALLEDKIVNTSAQLEQSSAKLSELETSCASLRQIENELTEKLHSTEKKLEEKEIELGHSLTEISALKSTFFTVNSDLKKALENEKRHLEEKNILEDKTVRLEGCISSLEREIVEATSRLSILEPLVEKSKIDLQTAAVNEGKLKEDISCHQESNKKLQDLLSQIQSEKDVMLDQHESSHKSLAQLNEKLIQEGQQLQSQITTLTKESNDLNEELRTCKDQLQAKIVELESSANQLQVSLSREALFDKQVTDLKIQLERALCTQKNLEELEEKLKFSIATEEHKAQIDELSAMSRIYQDKLAEAEKHLSDTKLEILKVQKAYDEREIHIKELEAKNEKSEVVDLKSSESIKSRDIDLDLQVPGKIRQRKKKGVTWELDNDVDVKAKANDKATHFIHSSNQIVVHVLFAIVSLTCGFWLARKIYL